MKSYLLTNRAYTAKKSFTNNAHGAKELLKSHLGGIRGLVMCFILLLMAGNVWGSETIGSNEINISSGWTNRSGATYCGGYGKSSGWYVSDYNITALKNVLSDAANSNFALTIEVQGICNTGNNSSVNSLSVVLLNKDGNTVGTAQTYKNLISGTNTPSANNGWKTFNFTPTSAVTGYKIYGGAYCAVYKTKYTLTYDAAPAVQHTVTWQVNGSTITTTNVNEGSKPTFPDNPSSCDLTSTTFIGWTQTTWSGKKSKSYIDGLTTDATKVYTSASQMPNVAGDVTYHAVFAKGGANTYVKGTASDLTDEQTVLIVNTANNVAIKGANEIKEALGVSISSNTITTTNKDVLWTVHPQQSGYYFKYDDNFLNGYGTSLYVDNYNSEDAWTLSGTGPYVLNSANATSGYKLMYDGSSAFTLGNSSGDEYNMDFFIPVTPSQYLTTCIPCEVNPTVTAASNNGVISSTSVPVQCASGISNIGGEGCGITSYGFCWAPSATTTTPTTSNSTYEVGTDYESTGTAFNYTITGLTPNTSYTIRPYATNGNGTAYGTAYTVTTLQRYDITYNNNGGTGSIDATTKDHGADFTLPANAGSMSKEGYHIADWKLGSASGTSYALGGTYDGNADAEFYAGWEPNTFSVAFNKNGGQGDAMTNQAFTYDAAQNLSANTYTPAAGSHKYFAGWAISTAHATAGTVDYADKASVSNLTSTNNGTYTLYAVWKDHTYTNYRTSCCTELGTIGGAVEFTDPTTAVVTWNDMSNVAASDPYAVTYRTGSDDFGSTNVGEITTNNTTGKKECTITGLSCNTAYDFQIEVTAATGYCDKEQIIEDQNSGKYAITLTGNGTVTGGTFEADEATACGGATIMLNATKSAGYNFSSWAISDGSSNITADVLKDGYEATDEIVEITMPAKDITVNASFSTITYTISYENMDGATNHVSNPSSYNVESADISLGNPTKSGFNFGGWFTDGDLAAGHEAGSPAIAAGSTGNKTFYAKWIADDKWSVAITTPSNGTITVSWNGGANSFDEGSQNINKNTVVTITATPSAGYELTSLKIGDEDFVSGNTHALTSSIVISATFSIINYDITYHLYGGTNSQGNPATFTINDDDIIFDEPTKTGYDFDDWYSNENFEGEAVNGVAHGTHENVDVWAKWTPNEYKVTIDKNYGTATSVDVTATFDAEMPSIIGKSISREGYSFAGIFANQDGTGTKYYNADKSSAHVWDQAEDKTIYAAWSPKNYTITLNNEGADDGKGGTASIAVTFDSNENLSGTPAITRPEKAGYKFCGYYTLANGDGSQIIDENGDVKASVSGYTSDTKQWRKAGSDVVTLYAYWRPIYTVTWSVNGTETTEPVIKDEKVAALPTAPTSSDCDDAKKFVGWRAEAIDGVSVSAPSGIFTTVAASPEITGNVTFYAVFADENGGDFTRVTNTNQLEAGKKVLLGYEAVANSGEIVPIQSASLNGTLLYTGATAGSAGTSTLTISSMSAGDEASFAFTLHEGHNSGYWAFEMSGDNAGNYLSHRGATDGKNSITSAESITDDGMTDFSIEIGTNDVTTIINKWGDQNTSKDGSNYNNYKILSYNVPNSGNPRAAIYKAVQTGQFVMYICNPLVYSNYVTTCASCTDVPTFNATPTISEIGCTSATVTATNGLESLGEGDGCNIREYGFVWGTTETPTVDSNNGKHSVSENIAEDVAWDYEITGLTKGTQYYVRAYAENKSGVAYSDAASFWTKDLSSIAITTAPTKTNYIVGEAFDATGMVVTATLAGGATEDVTADVTYSTSALTVGVDQDFTISYTLCETEKTANQTINVYTLSVNEGTNADKGVASYTTGATFSVGSLAEYTTFNFDVTNGFVTPNGDGTTYTVTPNGSGDVTVTVNYVTAVQVAVKYYINGVEQTELQQNPYQSEEFTLKTASDISSASLAGYPNFVGWSTTPFGYQTSEPTLAPTATQVMEPTNYYAVFTNLESVQIVPNDFNGTKAINEGEKTIDGVKYNIHEMCKQNGIQFSSGGYLYTIDAIRDIKKVEITGIDLPVYVCSNASGSVDGSAITSVGTAPYVYTFPANKQYLKITDRNGTSKVSLIKIYYAPEDVYYATEFKTLTFNKANGAVDKTEKVATGKTRTLSADDAPAAVTGYTFMEKWSDGSNDYVAGDDVTVNADMTLNPYSSLTTGADVDINALPATVTEIVVTDGKTLTVNVDKTLDNLTIEAGGKVETTNENELTVINNLTIESEAGKSGQVSNAGRVHANNVYMDVTFYKGASTINATLAKQWYMISAPFDVNLNGGFCNPGDGSAMTFGYDFDLFEYDGAKRASTGTTGWKRVSGKMKAGTACLIALAQGKSTTIRLKAAKAANATLAEKTSIALNAYSGADDANSNWNGVANPNLHYISIDKDAQTYNNDARSYNPSTSGSTSFVVGTAFFIHGKEDASIVNTIYGDLRAPRRATEAQPIEFCVRLQQENASWANRMYIRASEEASAHYEAGRDLETMNGTNGNNALLWSNNYGMRLAIEEAPIVDNKASYALSLYAPADGTYRIETPTENEDATLYLTKDGRAIWNLSMSACEVELSKGTTENYGLLLVRKTPGVATGNLTPTLSQGEGAKILIDEHVYILRGGQMYDVTGKAVK